MASSTAIKKKDKKEEIAQLGSCETCGKDTTIACGRCKTTFYCSRDCQKDNWKVHKKTCFPPNSVCTRCQETIVPGSKCRVPHPDHVQVATSSMIGGGERSWSFHCTACDTDYKKSCARGDGVEETAPITKGKAWCFEGYHTIQPLPGGDDRRVYKDVVVLSTSSDGDLTAKLQALDDNESVRILKIKGTNDSSVDFSNTRMPNLEEFQSLDVNLGKLELTRELTPKIQKIWMQNPSMSEKPDFRIDCPQLKDCTIYYCDGDLQWVQNMLTAATELERFDSYKLRGCNHLNFASNDLRSIRLHRAECLERLDLWAPRLTNLDVQAAYDLEQVHFQKNHALKHELGEDFGFDEPLRVNATNASLSRQAIGAIASHPRVDGPRFQAEMIAQEDAMF